MNVSTVGLDLAKNVFQVHAINEAGEVIVRKALRRRQVMPFFSRLEPCLIGMEACGTSHFWAREIAALGHEVKLMPPAYVKPYVKRGKTDAGDAAAICEAVTRPTMRFVAAKSPEQQAMVALLRSRDLLIRQRTQLVNMIRSQLAEFGIVLAKGIQHALKLVDRLLDGEALDIPALAARVLITLAEQVRDLPSPGRQPREGAEDLVARQSGRKTPSDHSGHRDHHGLGPGGVCHRSPALHLGPAVCRLARLDTSGRFQRRQGAFGAHLQDGRSLSAPTAGDRDDITAAMAAPPPGGSALGCRALAEKARQAGRCRPGQQDRAGRLGRHDPW